MLSDKDLPTPKKGMRSEVVASAKKVLLGQVLPTLNRFAFATFYVDVENRIFYFSEPMASCFSFDSHDGIEMKTFIQFFPSAQREEARDLYERYFQALIADQASLFSVQHDMISPSGHPYFLQISMQRVLKEKPLLAWGIIVDKSKSASQEILSRLYSEEMNVFIFHYDMLKDICYVNPHLKKALGLPRNAVEEASDKVLSFIHPDDQASFIENLEHFMQGKSHIFKMNFRLRAINGSDFWVSSHGMSFSSSAGQPRFLTGLLIDQSDKNRPDMAMKGVVEGKTTVVFAVDLARDELTFSEDIMRVFPEFEQKICGDLLEKMTKHVLPEDKNAFIKPMRKLIDGKANESSSEFRVHTPDGSLRKVVQKAKVVTDKQRDERTIVGTLVMEGVQVDEIAERGSPTRHEITELPVRGRLLLDIEKVIHDRNLLSAAVLLLDIRDFNTYNDRFGRDVGNEILKNLARVMKDNLPSGATLYHINSETFCILWPHATTSQVERLLKYLHEETQIPCRIEDQTYYLTLCMSAAIYPAGGQSADELLSHAEISMHKIKGDTMVGYAIFDAADKEELKTRLDFEYQLSSSIRNSCENFILFYQPLVDSKGERLIGAEALLRWISPGHEMLRTEKVIAGLEATGHMYYMGTWVIEQAVRQCQAWIAMGIDPAFSVHANISADDLVRSEFSSRVRAILEKYGLAPENLVLEITETSLMKNISICKNNLREIRQAGIRIAIDDFGTGYSSLNYLRDIPADIIKIDKAFVDNIENDKFNHSFVSAIVLLAHSISRDVCVEGIENHRQAAVVRNLDPDYFQGFFFGKPVSAGDFASLNFGHLL